MLSLQNRGTRTACKQFGTKPLHKSNAYLETLAADIHTITLLEDPDSDDLDQQERLTRSQNSISGLFALSLAEAAEKRPELLSELVTRADSAVVTALLAAKKCYQPNARAAASDLITKLGQGDPVVGLLQQARITQIQPYKKEAFVLSVLCVNLN